MDIIFLYIKRGLYDNVYNCINRDKVNVNQRDGDTGNPPLVVAIQENQKHIVELLLDSGADVNITDWTGKNTALDIAEQKNNVVLIDILKKRGARYGSGSGFHLAAKNGDIVSIEDLLNKGQSLNEVDSAKGWSALHYATHFGQKHIVEYLIVRGADVNVKDFLGKDTPIDVLSLGNRGEIARMLVKAGGKSAYGPSIHFCSEIGDFAGVQRFYDADGKINNRDDKNGWMPIHYAVNAGDIEMVEYLLCLGANINGSDFKGEVAPLDLAIKTGNVKMQELVKAKGGSRKKKVESGGGGPEVYINVSNVLKDEMRRYFERREKEEARLKKIIEEEEQKNKNIKKKEKKTINWQDFLKSKDKPAEEIKAVEQIKPEPPKILKKIVKQVEVINAEVKSSRLELDVIQTGYIFFMDIVGYSKKTTEEQRKCFKDLGEIVKGTVQFKTANALEKLIVLPTGDGMILGFFTYLEDAINCAITVAKAVKNRPDLEMRMGVHCGDVCPLEDINGNLNISGDGINYAQRVMDSGEGNHLLVSADVIVKYERPPNVLVQDLGDVVVKHSVVMHLYSLYGSDFGNKEFPLTRVKKVQPETKPK